MNKVILAIVAVIAVSAAGCLKKGGLHGSSPSGTGKLLTKEVTVSYDAQNNVIDSSVNLYQYDASKRLIQKQGTAMAQQTGIRVTGTTTLDLVYSGNVISSLSQTTNSQTTTIPVNFTTTVTGQMNTVFHANGNQVTSYVSTTTETSSGFSETGRDSALLSYDGNGDLSSCMIYGTVPGSMAYAPFIKENFTYSGGNLTQVYSVDWITARAATYIDTITYVYQYNDKLSASPLFDLVPGVDIVTGNDVTKAIVTTKGYDANVNTFTYQTTYTSDNQPETSTATVTYSPVNPAMPAVVKEWFYYE